jgi:hypothetical protein
MTRMCALCLLFLSIVLAQTLSAQVAIQKSPVNETLQSRYLSIGSHFLRDEDAKVQEYLRLHPDNQSEMRLRKPAAWNFIVGSTHTWYSVDFTNLTRYQVPATCRAVGTNCYVFVEDALWTSRANQVAVDSVRNAFDLRCPANSSKGIYQMDVDAFGNPPDVDSDPRIIILILDIRDGYAGSGGFIEGYFSGYNETPQAQSNNAEIYFLDANPLNLLDAAQLEEGLSTTAHEFQHMIHYNYDPGEITFMNEGCSLVAEVNCGYPIYDQSGFTGEANHYLFDWRSSDMNAVLRDYSRAARFTTYLRDQEGMGLFKPLVASTQHGINGINAGLSAISAPVTFDDLLKTWAIANFLNDTTSNHYYGYRYPTIQTVEGVPVWNPNTGASLDTVQPLAAEYIEFHSGQNLHATFTWTGSTLTAKAVERGPSGTRILDIQNGVQFSEPLFGTTYTDIAVVISNSSSSSQAEFSWQSSGTATAITLQWETTLPEYYYKLVPGDTVVVTFDGIPSGHLDSVSVALRGINTLYGGVWQYTGAVRPTPLGARLAGPFTVVGRVRPPSPYPVPWPNWITTNLSSSNIIVDQPFVVGYVLGADSTAPMVTMIPGTSAYHSYTYLQQTSGSDWFYITSGDSTPIWLIHAYVSVPGTGVSTEVTARPLTYELHQNYPNPFNPGTVIGYSLARTGKVAITVYNVLGEVVDRISPAVQQAGIHSVAWTPGSLPSGVYFYRLEVSEQQSDGSYGTAAAYQAVKKMILLR